jgi:hypothetical protein
MKPKPSQIFLALTISLLIFLFPAYLRFADLADDELSSSDLIIDQHKESKAFVSVTFFDIPCLEINTLEYIPRFSSLIDPFDRKASVLRC